MNKKPPSTIEASNLWYKGYDAYDDSKVFSEVFPNHIDYVYQSTGYYLHCGWRKAEVEAEEELRLASRIDCPFCGQPMEEYSSGSYCTDEVQCKYHTHNEPN